MSRGDLIADVLGRSPEDTPGRARISLAFVAVLVLALSGVSFGVADDVTWWVALLPATAILAGVALVGPLLSAIFQLTGAKWGRAYRRLAEGSVMLMPLALLCIVALLAGGHLYLPWVHEHPHVGGKALWLTRPFWDLRVVGALLLAYGVGVRFVYLSLRRDFCIAAVREKFASKVGRVVAKGLTDRNADAEAARCSRGMTVLAPFVCILYGVLFTLLGFDLIMALEPDWFSTLFGAWYFVGNIFAALALLALVGLALRKQLGLERFLTTKRQADLATLLLAFCLLNVDFFWNQYLTIWYANLPEETFYLIERTVDTGLPWRSLSFVSLATFFLIPFVALLLRRVKRNGKLLAAVAVVSLIGLLIARFIEVAPALLGDRLGGTGPLVELALALALLVALLRAGRELHTHFLAQVPVMPVGDPIFVAEHCDGEGHG